REYDAVCVTTAEEIAELAPLPAATRRALAGEKAPADEHSQTVEQADNGAARPAADPTGTRIRLLDALAPRSARTAESIATLSGLAVDRVRAELGLLALEGAVREHAGGWVKVSA